MLTFVIHNINRSIYILICFFIIPVYALEAGTIRGTIMDSETGENLPGASVYLIDTNLGASSDYRGRFAIQNIHLDGTEIKLQVHLIGYEDEIIYLGEVSDLIIVDVSLTPSEWKMESVVVTGTRRNYILKDAPVTTELITADEFNQTGALTVDEALSSHIGIDITDDLSGKGVSLRGIDPTRVLVLIDGNRVIGRVRGSLDISQIPLANVKQIEIIKGTGSTLYGSDAIGGVVNIITQKPPALTNLNLYGSYGSFNAMEIQVDANSVLLGNGLNFTAKYEHTDGFDLDKTTEHTNGLENIDRFNINNKTVIDISPGWDIEFAPGFMAESKYWHESELVQIGVDRDTTYNYDDYEYNYRYDLVVKSRTNLKDKADFTVSLQGSLYDHTWEKYTRSNIWIDTSETVDDIVGASFQYNRMFNPNNILTFGGDITSQGLKSDQLASGKERISYEDLYAQYELRLLKKVVLLPGLRVEHHQTYGYHFNPGGNILWDACDYFNLRATVSRGYRAPSIKELYFEFDHSAAGYIVYGGGEGLEPEKSWNYALTGEISYNKKAIHRISIFRNDLANLIEFSEGDFSDPTYWRGIYYYDNIVKAQTQGFEWETEIEMLEHFDLSFSYTYLLSRNLSEDIDLINRPQHTFKFNTGYLFDSMGANINFWGYWHDHKLWVSQGDTPERISNDYAPSRWNLNAGISKGLPGKFDLLLKIENITNEINAKYGYWPERSFSLSVTFDFERGK